MTVQFYALSLKQGEVDISIWISQVGGEAQEIDRAMENFGRVYYKQQVNGLMENSDAAYVLAFSLIMLNTDLHTPGVKKKMTIEQFVNNNRGINGKKDFPKEFLDNLYR